MTRSKSCVVERLEPRALLDAELVSSIANPTELTPAGDSLFFTAYPTAPPDSLRHLYVIRHGGDTAQDLGPADASEVAPDERQLCAVGSFRERAFT